MPADPNRVETIFHAALALPAADRGAFLAAECGPDAELRARVERLLAAHDELGAPDDGPRTEDHTPQPDVGTLVGGKYKLLEEIGEGGMGTVWMAQQTEPVKRTVAVKLIKAGMDSRAVLARFEAERQALAMMDHPNIAKVLDAGATPDGRPFFVMELVKGIPITQYCDEHKLNPRQRLELFVPVCNAIQHAHQKGVIHRDIKPSNVQIALYDDKPVPKVIDFGVAKAAGQPLTEKTLATGFGAVVGTPEYMSPEQASFNNLDIDTRSDVYALGVLLYELLAGSPPFSRKDLEKIGLLEIFRVIREQEPPRPSTKLSTADALPSLSANRGTEPKALTRLLRGELDWIVMKALEKDRNRRYETANGFAADVQRYLAGEPVQAVPPSAGYRLRKFLKRNRGPVIAVSLVLLALVGGIAGTTIGLIYADKARRAAETAEGNEREERGKADVARRAAERFAAGAQVDLDLKYCHDGDTVLGLLRLCRTVSTIPDHAPELRECVVLNILAWGQRFSPLVNLHHDGFSVTRETITPDGTVIVTLGEDGTARLFDTFTGRQLAVLRANRERAEQLTLSGDGKTAAVAGDDRVVRLWDVPSGRLRAATAPHTGSVVKIALSQDAGRLVTGVNVTSSRPEEPVVEARRSIVQLWDGTTGSLIRRLDPSSDWVSAFDIGSDGHTILTCDGTGSLRAWSGEDGRLIKHIPRLGTPVRWVLFSPSARTACTGDERTVDWWDAGVWELLGETSSQGYHQTRFVNDSVLECYNDVDAYSARLIARPPTIWTRYDDRPTMGNATVLISGRGQRADPVTGRVIPTVGRRFAPEAKALATDGRYLLLGTVMLIDLLADRPIGGEGSGYSFIYDMDERNWHVSKLSRPEASWLVVPSEGRLSKITLLPLPGTEILVQFLQQYAECVIRHELDPSGSPVKLSESAWDQKRQQLLALAGTDPILGRLAAFAADRWYWLRRELAERALNDEQALEFRARLIAVEPNVWQHYRDRARAYRHREDWYLALRDEMTAARLAGSAWRFSGFDSSSCVRLLGPSRLREHYQIALDYLIAHQAQSGSEDRARTDLYLATAQYRLGNYADALATLRAADRFVAARAVGCLMSPWAFPVVTPGSGLIPNVQYRVGFEMDRALSGLTGADPGLIPDGRVHAIRAMADYRLGNIQSAIKHLKVARWCQKNWSYSELDLTDEAVRLIEGDNRSVPPAR